MTIGSCRLRMGALGAGAVAAALVTTALTSGFTPRTWEYSEIATNFLAGRGLEYQYLEGTIYRFYGPPLYPLLLAALKWLTGGDWLTLILQAGLFAGTASLIYSLARELFGRTHALLAGALAATHPGGLFFAGQLHAQTLDVLSITLAFVLLVRIAPSASPTRALVTGIAGGLAALGRGPFLPFLAAWGMWFLWKNRRRRGAVGTASVVAVGLILPLAPVFVRGYALYGTPVPLRTDTGVNLWYGNHSGASGTSHTLTTPPQPITVHLSPELRARLSGVDEVQQNRILTAAALDFIRAEPGQALALFVKKVWYFCWFSPHAGLSYPAWWFRAYMVYYVGVLLTAVVGLSVALNSLRGRDSARLFLLLAGAIGFTQAVFYVEGRHRWEIEPLLLMFSAVGLVAFGRALSSQYPIRLRAQVPTGGATLYSRPRR